MFKKLIVVLFLLLFSTNAIGSPIDNFSGTQPNIIEEQAIQYTFLYNALVIDIEILPAIYKYLDLSDFKKPLTIEQQKEIFKNIIVVFSAYSNKRGLDFKVNLQFVNNANQLMIFVYFYEYNLRSSQFTLVSIGRQIPIFKNINNSEIEIME